MTPGQDADPNRITNLVLTLKDGEGALIKVGDIEVTLTLAHADNTRSRRIYFDASRSVSITRIKRPEGW